jgi:hypothetical protein
MALRSAAWAASARETGVTGGCGKLGGLHQQLGVVASKALRVELAGARKGALRFRCDGPQPVKRGAFTEPHGPAQ